MSLFKKANIYKRNKKNEKTIEARPPFPRFELFLIIAILILIISPFIINFLVKFNAEKKIINLYISAGLEELFGKETEESLLNEFNESNPDIGEPKIRVRLFKPDDKTPDLQEPDIFIFNEYDSAGIVNKLIDLKSFIAQEENINLLNENYLLEDELFKIPLVSFMDVLFYNIDILSEAGFDRPPRTRGEYNTYARTVADNAIQGIAIYSDDLSSPENNKPIQIKIEDFANGKAAMIVASTRAIPYFREKLGDDTFGITAIPFGIDGSAGRYDINLTGIYAGIGAECVNPDAAWKFIVFLIDKSPLFCELLEAVPGIPSSVIPPDYIKDDPIYSKAWDIFEYNRE